MTKLTRYTAISIGPVVSTLMMARRPRELWSASYLFSHLMKCVIDSLQSNNKLISPAVLSKEDSKQGIGLYPDRVFVEGDVSESVLDEALKKFIESTKVEQKDKNSVIPASYILNETYFNRMYISCEEESEGKAIKRLNAELDKLELINYAIDDEARTLVMELIRRDNSPLFELAFSRHNLRVKNPGEVKLIKKISFRRGGDNILSRVSVIKKVILERRRNRLPVESLGEISAAEKKSDSKNIWMIFRNTLLDEKTTDDPYKKAFGEDYKSYHKYFCVVQADGDNVGKTVSHEQLKDGTVNEISKALLEFGKDAKDRIIRFGGLPIYAGGDDLLFIAPVIGKDHSSIFDLLDEIDKQSFKKVADLVEGLQLKTKKKINGEEVDAVIKASLSYGISISYYKYPLYEAFETARHLLFDVAKRVETKNAVAWQLRKHSGSGFAVAFSKSHEALKKAFGELIEETSDGNTVTALAHKIRANEVLVNEVMRSPHSIRLDALFEELLEYKDTSYFNAVKNIMRELYTVTGRERFTDTLYNMLRTAKFIKGEEPIDE